MSRLRVPVNPEVVKWAAEDSGMTSSELAARLKRPLDEFQGWQTGESQPTQAQLRNFAEIVRRPSAIFYLSTPPQAAGMPPSLRSAPGLGDHNLRPDEIRKIRWFVRLQRTLSWLAEEDDLAQVTLPTIDGGAPEEAAGFVRDWLGVSLRRQLTWSDGREALEQWRGALEEKGVLVAQFQIDRQAIRGFSARDHFVPLIAVNTAYTPTARVFSLLHELGHLVRGDDSACIDFAGPDDPREVERWCERFAAAVLLPRESVRSTASIPKDIDDEVLYRLVHAIARKYKASLRATALRLIELGIADRSIYNRIDRIATARFDDFPRPSPDGGGGGQTAAEARLTQFGRRTVARLLSAADDGSLTNRDVGDYLHLSPTQVGDLINLISS